MSVPVVFALLGGTLSERVETVRTFAKRLDSWSDGKKIMVLLIDAPPDMSDNKWVSNDIAQRVVMFNERQKYLETLHRMNEGEFDYGFIVSIESAYALVSEAMRENSSLSAKVSNGTLLGADGQPLNKESILVNQLAGSVMYSRGLIPYIYGPNAEFFSGGVWVLGTEEEDAQIVERLVGKDEETGNAITQKIPSGTPTQVSRFMDITTLDGMSVNYGELPVGIEAASAELFERAIRLIGDKDGEE